MRHGACAGGTRGAGHRAYLGTETIPWLTTDWVLAQFGKNVGRARLEYRKFVELGKDDGHRQEFHDGGAGDSRILGDDAFTDRVLAQADEKTKHKIHLEEIIACVCREYAIEEKVILQLPANIAAFRRREAWRHG